MASTACRTFDVDGVTFNVPEQYVFVKKLGAGKFGTVASFQDSRTQKKVAVKKLEDTFREPEDGKRCLREVKLLCNLRHPNIISIVDIFPPDSPDFDDIYIALDLMDTDLERVIKSSKTPLSEEHHQFLTYQILCGLHYLHSANIVHRDLKPGNVLTNKQCDVKICDFGWSRGFAPDEDGLALTSYVVARWYRAPEVVLSASEYTKSIDIWSVGCILGEMIGRKPLFVGRDQIDQLKKIFHIMGRPSPDDLGWLPASHVGRGWIAKCEDCPRQPWPALLPTASAAASEALDAMLTFHPERRVEVRAAMRLPYFAEAFDASDEIVADAPIDWKFEALEPTRLALQNHIYVECCQFHPSIRERDAALLPERGIDKLL